MSSQEIEVLVIGAGQAGLAMTAYLSNNGVPHLVVERHASPSDGAQAVNCYINGPAGTTASRVWDFPDLDPDALASKDRSRSTSWPTRRRSPPRSGAVSR